jgi:large subunit ribosomal protein L21
MSYAIISLGGKQYRVQEGQRLLVDRVALDDGATFTPSVLLVGGNGETQIAPAGVTVTARVLGQQRGPKLRIGKYKKRTGYRRHTGFRAALTQIEIESIGAAKRARAAAKPKASETPASAGAAAAKETPAEATPEPAAEVVKSKGLPEGYDELTVAQIKDASADWDAAELTAALVHERAHAKRKGAIAALEAALVQDKET